MSSSSAQFGDEEKQSLEALLDVFGELCSLEEIADAYSKSKGDMIIAGDILCSRHKTSSQITNYTQNETNSSQIQVSESQETNSRFSKSRKGTASLGTVSTVLGNSYNKNSYARREIIEKTKPVIIEVPQSVLDLKIEDSNSNSNNSGTKMEILSNRETEQFLFSMLGDGFKLSMDVIKEVLGSCGYDIEKSMEELLDYSKRLEKSKFIDDWTSECSGSNKNEAPINPPSNLNSNSPHAIRNNVKKDKSGLSREVLNSLFNMPERAAEEQVKPRFDLGINRNRESIYKPVTKPLVDDVKIPLPADLIIKAQLADETQDLEGDDEYMLYREVTKQNWASMKEYFSAAINAFKEGKIQDAYYLLEQVRHYYELAREFEVKSAAHLVELEQEEKKAEQEVSLDLSDLDLSDAIYLLKVHLCKFAKIPSFHNLRVVVEPNNEDPKKMKIRRKVLRILDKEGLKWSEDEAIKGNILIPLDQIDRDRLSFANKFKRRDIDLV